MVFAPRNCRCKASPCADLRRIGGWSFAWQGNIAVHAAPIRLLALCTVAPGPPKSAPQCCIAQPGRLTALPLAQQWALARPAVSGTLSPHGSQLSRLSTASRVFCDHRKKSMTPAVASTHLVIADDHPLFRDALRQAVASVVKSAIISEAGSFDDLTALLERDSDVDLILLDLTMPGISGFSGLIYLRAQYPAITVVIV